MSLRRLWALAKGLPRDAAVRKHNWTQTDELLAGQIEGSDFWGRQIVTAIAALGGQKLRQRDLPRPIHIDHPERGGGRPAGGPRRMSVGEFIEEYGSNRN